MVKELICSIMEILIQANSKIIYIMDKDFINTIMETAMKANLKKE
jgi:hypothetical protein